MNQHVSITYEQLPDGGLRFTAATLDGLSFSVDMPADEAMDNLRAFAKAFGLIVSIPV